MLEFRDSLFLHMIFSCEKTKMLLTCDLIQSMVHSIYWKTLFRFVLFYSFLNKMQPSFTNLERKSVSTLRNQNKLNKILSSLRTKEKKILSQPSVSKII